MTDHFQSVTGQTLTKRVWKPEGEVRAIVQIVHGMAEYIDCYDETAKRLNQAGFLVVGHTHLGHGKDAEVLGWFGSGGFDALVEDVHTLRKDTQKEYPDVPYFLLGHSMGSFIVRNYCLKHEQGLRGVILSGTGYFTPGTVGMGLVLANLLCAFGGEKKPAKLLENISFAGYNTEWAPPRTPFDWISRNEAKVDAYIADPLCGFTFTAGGYRDMFRGLQKLYPDNLSAMDKEIPILLYSGASDPVGGRGTGVQKVAAELKAAGVEDVTMKLYPNGRHEMHNEPNREEVFSDLIDWIVSRL
ncbi:MAG TPA: lysophospholipase [Candidatus Limiplasma sp.]|nr:lysophospholipase [Candidatus Limiplasma sp.]